MTGSKIVIALDAVVNPFIEALEETKVEKIVLFDADGLEEYGSHEELMEKKGKYYEMFVIQGKYYQEEAV